MDARDYSVGGIVTDADGRIAVIRTRRRDGRVIWSLPKGHVEDGETPLQAALREVAEETGLEVEATGQTPVATIEYSFVKRSGLQVTKRVDFYRMRAVGGDPAGHDDEVEEVALLAGQQALARISYPNERTALRDALCG